MAQFSASGKVNYNKLKTKLEEKNEDIQDRIELILRDFGKDVISNKLSKIINKDSSGKLVSGMWVIDKRGEEKSLKSYLKWRTYVERRSPDRMLLMFRNDAVNNRYKNKPPSRYAKYLIGADGLYKAEAQGLDEDTWLVFREHLKIEIKNIITGEWK